MKITDDQLSSQIERDGYAVVDEAISSLEVSHLISSLPPSYAARNLLQSIPEVLALADSLRSKPLVSSIMGTNAQPVKATLFDKTPNANWLVPWHQDLMIAVENRLELPGFGPWSRKGGVHHVQPPTSILARMLAVRVHLDACTEDNGALRVIPGSHRTGKLSDVAAQKLHNSGIPVTCVVPKGGAMLMRPLLLHASSEAKLPHHRRVIHIEYASEALPGGLRWPGHAASFQPEIRQYR